MFEACFLAFGRRQCAGAVADCGLPLGDCLEGGSMGLTTAGCRDRCEGSRDGCTRRFGIVGLSQRSRDCAKRGCPRAAFRDLPRHGEGR